METKNLVIILVIGVAIIFGYLAFYSGPVVEAQGYSSVTAEPDEVSVYIYAEAKNISAENAKDKLGDMTDKIVLDLIKLGIDQEDIQSLSYQIYPDQQWDGSKYNTKGYIASQQIVIKLKDFDKVAGVVDAGVDNGAVINSINFELSQEKQNEYKEKALVEAGEDAKSKAEATAKGLGRGLGRLVSVQSQEFYYPGPMAYYAKAEGVSSDSLVAEARSAALNISPGDLEVTANLRVTYRLSLF